LWRSHVQGPFDRRRDPRRLAIADNPVDVVIAVCGLVCAIHAIRPLLPASPRWRCCSGWPTASPTRRCCTGPAPARRALRVHRIGLGSEAVQLTVVSLVIAPLLRFAMGRIVRLRLQSAE
jgi:hypothetical protein